MLALLPVVVLATALWSPYGSGLPYAAAVLAQVIVVVVVLHQVRERRRLDGRSSGADLVGLLVAGAASGATLWVVRRVANTQGIEGSAWARLRLGLPAVRHDHLYLGASAAVGISLAVLLVAAAAPTKRRLHGSSSAAGASPGEVAAHQAYRHATEGHAGHEKSAGGPEAPSTRDEHREH